MEGAIRYAIMGNSGSGKSWLARELSTATGLPVLDLDTIVWEPGKIAVRRAAEEVNRQLHEYLDERQGWIVEGCYGDLIETSLGWMPHLIFLNPGLVRCKENCLSRPHEPQKYATAQEQDRMLEFLLQWVEEYYHRADEMSLAYHAQVFSDYSGPKEERV